MTDSVRIQRILRILLHLYEEYENKRIALLNHMRMVQYLFGPALRSFDGLADALMTLCRERQPTFPHPGQARDLDMRMIELLDLREQYSRIYRQLTNKYGRLSRSLLPYHPVIDPLLTNIHRYLISEGISYIPDWNFTHMCHSSSSPQQPYSFGYDLRANIFGCILEIDYDLQSSRMFLFAIVDNRNWIGYSLPDYLDQYCFQQMGIHLFRIRGSTTIDNFQKFIKRVKRKRTYQIHNKLTMRRVDNEPNKLLNLFHTDYQSIHRHYLRYMSHLTRNDINIDPIILDPEPDQSTDHVLSPHDFQDLLKRLG